MIVWLWQAGTTQGVVVTGNQATVRRKVASFMRDTGAVTAVLEMAYFDVVRSLNAAYVPADGQRWVARCHPSGRVSWRLRAPSADGRRTSTRVIAGWGPGPQGAGETGPGGRR